MNNFGDLDKPLNFHNDSEILEHGNTPTIGVERSVYDASNRDILKDAATGFSIGVRKTQERGELFGANGGKAAQAYCKGAREMLHHKTEYAPCRVLSPAEYHSLKRGKHHG